MFLSPLYVDDVVLTGTFKCCTIIIAKQLEICFKVRIGERLPEFSDIAIEDVDEIFVHNRNSLSKILHIFAMEICNLLPVLLPQGAGSQVQKCA